MLATSDAWSMSRSSHRPSEPVYYIEDCRISGWNQNPQLLQEKRKEDVGDVQSFRDEPPFLSTLKTWNSQSFQSCATSINVEVLSSLFTIKDTIGVLFAWQGRMRCSFKKTQMKNIQDAVQFNVGVFKPTVLLSKGG